MTGRVQKEVARIILDAVSNASPGAFTDVAGTDSPILLEVPGALQGSVNGLLYAIRYLAEEVDGLMAGDD